MRRRESKLMRYLRELRSPRGDRAAARAERRVEAEFRRQRDNEHSAERRADALEAERRRRSSWSQWR